MEGDPLNKVIAMVVAAIVGIVMVVGAFLPIAAQQITNAATISGIAAITGGATGVQALLSVVVIMVIVGLIVGIVYYIRSDR